MLLAMMQMVSGRCVDTDVSLSFAVMRVCPTAPDLKGR